MDVVRIDLVHPRHRAGWFGAELTRWLLAQACGLPGVRLRPAPSPASGPAPSPASGPASGPRDVAKASFGTFSVARASLGTFGAAAPDAAAPDARVLLVRDDGRVPDVTSATGDPHTPVALVGYGGRSRGRPALDRAREALEHAAVPTPPPSFGVNAAAVREAGFAEADALLWSLVLDVLRDAVVVAA